MQADREKNKMGKLTLYQCNTDVQMQAELLKGCKNALKNRQFGRGKYFFEFFEHFVFTNRVELCYNSRHRKSGGSFV